MSIGKQGIEEAAGGLTYTELAGGENKSPTASGTWEDWDLSAIVPVGTQYVEIANAAASDAGGTGARENGSALNRKNALTSWVMTVKVDANRVIEIRADTVAARFKGNVMGYWS